MPKAAAKIKRRIWNFSIRPGKCLARDMTEPGGYPDTDHDRSGKQLPAAPLRVILVKICVDRAAADAPSCP